MKQFYLVRSEDVSGVSGTGVVAEGCVFTNGKVALAWISPYRSVTVFDSLEEVDQIHGHDGRTKMMWVEGNASQEQLPRPVPSERAGGSLSVRAVFPLLTYDGEPLPLPGSTVPAAGEVEKPDGGRKGPTRG